MSHWAQLTISSLTFLSKIVLHFILPTISFLHHHSLILHFPQCLPLSSIMNMHTFVYSHWDVKFMKKNLCCFSHYYIFSAFIDTCYKIDAK
jgi:hypothetical protein